MIKLDISNKHSKKYVAFALTVNNEEHIIAADTKLKLFRFLTSNNNVFEDFYIFNRAGKLVEAYEYSHKLSIDTIMNYELVVPYEKIKFDKIKISA